MDRKKLQILEKKLRPKKKSSKEKKKGALLFIVLANSIMNKSVITWSLLISACEGWKVEGLFVFKF